jgi:hypothetical protein
MIASVTASEVAIAQDENRGLSGPRVVIYRVATDWFF